MPQTIRKRSSTAPGPDLFTQASNLLKQMAHPVRLALLCHLLHHGESGVGALVASVQGRAGQSQVSQFLKQMRLGGLVQSRKDGQQVFYRLAAPVVQDVVAALDKSFCAG